MATSSNTFKKLNRCTVHNQQIVALCIEENCKLPTKALCPLQLYNQHQNHKFENINKVFNQWSLYQKDMLQVQTHSNRNTVFEHMDDIINQIMSKVKEHLLQIRKEFELKINFYYDSKPVQKIHIGMKGLKKVVKEKFLELTHEQIQQARFFTQVYGMKKLVFDTKVQRHNFQKQILISYSKVKQQMFMDYPKFNAMFKAKQFEYCQIIKKLRDDLNQMQQKYLQRNQRHSKLDQQNKQLSYQFNRSKNQLKNKQAMLYQTLDKAKLITKKYNQQAQQAIKKAKQIMSKGIYGTSNIKHLHRVNDRIMRVGDEQFQWPQFADMGIAQGKIWIRINRFDVGSWVLIGVFHRKLQQRNQYQFDNYNELNHGCYLMDNNRWIYSSLQQKNNCKALGFQFGVGDILKIEMFVKQSQIRISKMVAGWQQIKMQMKVKDDDQDPLYFCIAMKGCHTQIEIV